MYNFGSYLSEKAYEEINKLQKPITLSHILDRLLQIGFSKSEAETALHILIQLEILYESEKEEGLKINNSKVDLYKSKQLIPKKFDISSKIVKLDVDYSSELQQLLSSWNKTFNVQQRYTSTLLAAYKPIRNKYSPEDIIYGIKKYILYKKQNTWYTHTFSLYDFLKQKNGFEKYFNS